MDTTAYDPELDDPVETYHETVTRRMGLQGDEEKMKSQLMELLHKKGLTTYETPGGIVVSLSKEEKVKVKKKKQPKDDDPVAQDGQKLGDTDEFDA